MLAYDAGVPQWFLKSLVIEPNYEGDENALHIYAGSIGITNWKESTLNRYDISIERENYDPVRTWDIAAHDLALSDGLEYFLYAKLPLDELETTGTLEISTEHVEVKRYIDDGYLYYKIADIPPNTSPRTVSALWGNVKYNENSIDPRLIMGGQSIFLHVEDSDISGYKQGLITEPDDEMAVYTADADFEDGEVLIKAWDTGTILDGMTVIPAGPWIFCHFMAVTGGLASSVVVKVYKRDIAGDEILLFSF